MKRFIETTMFDDPWVCELAPDVKLVWVYLFTKCDNAGVWTPNIPLANFQLGRKLKWDQVAQALSKNVVILPNGKWWIPSFIRFQFGVLSPAAKVHQSVLSLIDAHGLTEVYQKWISTRSSGNSVPTPLALPPGETHDIPSHSNGIPIPPGKGKGTVQGKGKGTGTGEEVQEKGGGAKSRATLEQWTAYCTISFPDWPEADIRGAWDHYETVGWVVGRNRTPVKDWEACARTCYANWKKYRVSGTPTRGGRYDGQF